MTPTPTLVVTLVPRADKWGIEMNSRKCKVLHIGRNNLLQEHTMKGNKLEKVTCKKDIVAVGIKNHDLSQA